MSTISAIPPDVPNLAAEPLRLDRTSDGAFRRVLESVGEPAAAEQSVAEVEAEAEPTAADRAADLAELRTAATALVASSFIVPILQSLREDPILEGGPFAPGAAERRFGPLLDEKIADRLTAGAALPLVDTVVDHMIGVHLKEEADDRFRA